MIRLRSRRPIGLPKSELREAFTTFRPALKGQRARIASAVVVALTITGLELIKPWPITWMIDHLVLRNQGAAGGLDDGTGAGASSSFTPIVAFTVVALAVPVLLGFGQERLHLIVAQVSRKATVRIRSDIFEHLQRLELVEHQKHYSGDLLMRLMGDVNMIRDLLFPSWLNLISRGSVLIGGAAVFLFVDARLFCVALIPLPLLWITVEKGSSAIKSAASKQRRKEGAIAATAAESFRQVGLIKAFAAEERTARAFREDARGAERATMAAARHAARMGRLVEVLTGTGVALVLILGATRVRAGLLTPGQLVLAISYTRMIYKPIRKLTGEGARIAKATACALRVMALLDQPIEEPNQGIRVSGLEGDIVFDGVSHSYPDGRVSLRELGAMIPAGSLVAIVGENGTGKSTLLSILLRLHRPTSGRVTIDGRSIDDIQLTAYRDQIAFVPQELSLFGGTIRENITFGNPEATDAQIEQAADAALLTPVLEQLPEGIDTVLDEDGSSLSGGQARRLMLARAAVRDASILLLDEPLVGLDPDARIVVAAAISNIAAGRTTLVVHHGPLDELRPDYQLRLSPSTLVGDQSDEAPRPRLRVVSE